MNRNKKGFNLFNNEMPFVLPQPIPEPPRVLNPRPMVPDLSITSDMSINGGLNGGLNGQPSHHKNHYLEKLRTLYISPPKEESPPKPVPFGHHFGHHFSNNLPQTQQTNHNFDQRVVSKQTLHQNNDFIERKRFAFNNNNYKNDMIFTNGRHIEDKPIESHFSVKPKIIRHSDDVQQKEGNKCLKLETKVSPQTDNCEKGDNMPSNAQMFEIIRQQDIQLQRISQQIQELLIIQKIDKTEQNINKITKRSVQTMTSIVLEDNTNTSPLSNKNRVKSGNNTPKTPSTASKDLRSLRLNTISESSEPSAIELDSNRLNFSESPMRPSIERIRANSSNGSDGDPFYGRMMDDIEVMLNNGSSEDTDSGRRSSCSPTPPHSRRQTKDRRHRIEIQSEQTLYIKRLAAKYSVDDSSQYRTKPKQRAKRGEQNERTDLNVYGLTKNASIATKHYLEKYGLTYSPPKVHKNDNFFVNNYRNKPKINRNKILDIEALKRMNKLT